MGKSDRRTGRDRRAKAERRSGSDTRSKDEILLQGERRSGEDRREKSDRRKSKTVSFRISEENYEKLKHISERDHRSMSNLVATVLEAHIMRYQAVSSVRKSRVFVP